MAETSSSRSKSVKLGHLYLDFASFTCVSHVSNLICSIGLRSWDHEEVSGLHLHSLCIPFENQALGSVSHLHAAHSATNPEVLLAPFYIFFYT